MKGGEELDDDTDILIRDLICKQYTHEIFLNKNMSKESLENILMSAWLIGYECALVVKNNSK